MNKTDKEIVSNKPDEISGNDVISKIQFGLKYLRTKFLIIFIVGVLGGLAGLTYSIINKAKYTATCTFVLDDGTKEGGLSQYAGLASLAGMNIGGGSSEGLFQGDNILELYKSRIMIEKTLLSQANFDGKNEMLIDRYIDYNNLRDKWRSRDNITNLRFAGDPEKFDRKQDSIVTDLVEKFNKSVLSITKPDKRLSIIKVEVTATDELFAKKFTDNLVETVSLFYIQTKTKKASETVRVLQRQADSVRIILNSSISGVASAIDASPNANPSLLSLKVPSQKKQIDVQASTQIYNEVVKNLELSKMTLRQDTPLIQVIDKPVLPLALTKVNKLKGILIGLVLSIFLTSLLLILRKIYIYK